MPSQKGGPSNKFAQVDRTHGAVRTVAAPLGFGRTSENVVGTLGHYQVAARTGVLAATLAADAKIFAFRWTHASRLAVITRFKATVQVLTAFTAHQELGIRAIIGRSFSAAYTGGTALTQTGNNFKKRASFATTSVGEIRVATTAALGGGTVTLDAQPFLESVGAPNIVNAAAATEYAKVELPRIDWRADVASGAYPLVLAQNEGLIVANNVVFPAAGTAKVAFEIEWAEVESYLGVEGNF